MLNWTSLKPGNPKEDFTEGIMPTFSRICCSRKCGMLWGAEFAFFSVSRDVSNNPSDLIILLLKILYQSKEFISMA